MIENLQRQYVLDLPIRSARGSHDFIVSKSNEEAILWLDSWPEWPMHGLVVCGPHGSGKTHLGCLWKDQSNAIEVKGSEVPEVLEIVRENERVLTCFVDDADTANPEPLLHLFNHMYSKGGYLLLTAKKPPAAWQLPLPDLMSRLKSLPISEIGLPDDDLLKGILFKMFDDKQVLVNSDLINFIVSRMNRSYGSALEIVERLNEESLSKKRAITIPFVRDVFREWI
ncbi:MAG: DnaA/Hda family protein [Rhodospirillaceae bacterium]